MLTLVLCIANHHIEYCFSKARNFTFTQTITGFNQMAALRTAPGSDHFIRRPILSLAAWFIVLLAFALALFGLDLANHHSTIPVQNMTNSFLDTIAVRRSWYALEKTLTLDQGKIKSMVGHAMQSVPSSFNSQSNRAVVLFGSEHDKLWDIVTDVLKARVTPDQWISTSQKTAGFKAAAGTVCLAISQPSIFTSCLQTSIPFNYWSNPSARPSRRFPDQRDLYMLTQFDKGSLLCGRRGSPGFRQQISNLCRSVSRLGGAVGCHVAAHHLDGAVSRRAWCQLAALQPPDR